MPNWPGKTAEAERVVAVRVVTGVVSVTPLLLRSKPDGMPVLTARVKR